MAGGIGGGGRGGGGGTAWGGTAPPPGSGTGGDGEEEEGNEKEYLTFSQDYFGPYQGYANDAANAARDKASGYAASLQNLGQSSADYGLGAGQALVGQGQAADQWGRGAAESLVSQGQQATQFGTGAATQMVGQSQQGQQTLTSQGLAAQNALGGYGTSQGTQLTATGQSALQAMTGTAGKNAAGIAGAGTAAQQQLGAYGQNAANALGAIGAGAGAHAGNTAQSIIANTAGQGRLLGDQASATAGGVANRALGQSSAIDAFAAQQAAASLDARNRAIADPNFAAANALYDMAGASAADLAAIEAVPGESDALAQLQSGLNKVQAGNLAMARSGRGWGGSASALSQAAEQNARASQEVANQRAIIAVAEEDALRKRQAANLATAAGLQTGLGGAMQNQTGAGIDLALRQQQAADQAALGFGSQALQGMTGAGDLALQGSLGAGDLALRGGTAGSDLALRGALGGGQLGLSGAQLQGQLAGQGAALGMQGLESGAQMGLQAQQAAANLEQQALAQGYSSALQAQQAGAGLGLEGLQSGYGMGLQGAQAGTALGQQGLVNAAQAGLAGYGAGIDATQAATDAGFRGQELGMQGTQVGAGLGLSGMQQAGQLYGAAGGLDLAGLTTANEIYAQDLAAQQAYAQQGLQLEGINAGVALQNSQNQSALLGAGLAAGGAILGSFLGPGGTVAGGAAGGAIGQQVSDRDAKTNIKPARDIVIAVPDRTGPPRFAPSEATLQGRFSGPPRAAPDAASRAAAYGQLPVSSGASTVVRGGDPIPAAGAAQPGRGSRIAHGLSEALSRSGEGLMTGGRYDFADAYRAGRGLVPSDERSKTRIAQLEGQVRALGGEPGAGGQIDPTRRTFMTGDEIARSQALMAAQGPGGLDPARYGEGLDIIRAADTRQGAFRGGSDRVLNAAPPPMELGYDATAGGGYGLYRPQGSVIGEGPVDPAYARDTGHMPLVYDTEAGIYRPDESPWGMPAPAYDVAALDEASRRGGIEPVMPSPRAAATAIDRAPAYEYEYREPDRFGPGRYTGPMAQDLERSPAGRSVVTKGPDGTKMVDTSRLSLLNTAALHQIQGRLDDLESKKPPSAAFKPASDIDYDRAALDAAYQQSAMAPQYGYPGTF